jgi:hypothetical protein
MMEGAIGQSILTPSILNCMPERWGGMHTSADPLDVLLQLPPP